MPDALSVAEISLDAMCMNHSHLAEEETWRGHFHHDILLVEGSKLDVVENAASLCSDHPLAWADCETFGEKQANGCAGDRFFLLEYRYRRQVGRVGMVNVLNGSYRYGGQLGSEDAALQGGRYWNIYHLWTRVSLEYNLNVPSRRQYLLKSTPGRSIGAAIGALKQTQQDSGELAGSFSKLARNESSSHNTSLFSYKIDLVC